MPETIANLTHQRDRFLAFVQRRVSDRAIAEDILQAAYTRALSRAGSLKADDSAEAWFFRILRNAVIDHYRHSVVEQRTFKPLDPEDQLETMQPLSEESTDICGCIHTAIDHLHPSYSEVLRKVDLDEAPLESFAAQSGITPGNAAVRAHRARKALHKQLLHHCGACAQAGCLNCNCASSQAGPSAEQISSSRR